MDRLTTLLAALHAGDALGSTSEFKQQDAIPALLSEAAPWPFEQVGGGAFNWPKDDPTDDGQQAIRLVQVLRDTGALDPRDVRATLVDWFKGNPPDIGGLTRAALQQASREGTPWYLGGFTAAKHSPNSLGNGSLMRNSVVAGMFPDPLTVFDATWRHSCVTHAQPLSVLCCMAHSWLIWTMLNRDASASTLLEGDWPTDFLAALGSWEGQARDGEWGSLYVNSFGPGWDEAKALFSRTEWGREWDAFERWEAEVAPGIGYVLVSLQIAVWAARWAISGKPYPTDKLPRSFQHTKAEDVFARTHGWVLAWVACLGGDSDTYGAIAGPLIAATGREIPREITPACYLD